MRRAARSQRRKQFSFLRFHFWDDEKLEMSLLQDIVRLVLLKKKKKKSQIDTTSVQAGHISSSYASEVYSSGAVERANEGIKKDLIVKT